MKILIDMNLSPTWVPFLAEHGIEAVHWSNVGAPTSSDAELLAYAAARGFVVFTHDLDFGMLLAMRKQSGPSVIQIRTQDVLPETLGPVLLRILETCREQLESGAIVTVDPGQNRIRMLPIR
jgi:predicted nuclease of predicted toxin-antitoxin system